MEPVSYLMCHAVSIIVLLLLFTYNARMVASKMCVTSTFHVHIKNNVNWHTCTEPPPHKKKRSIQTTYTTADIGAGRLSQGNKKIHGILVKFQKEFKALNSDHGAYWAEKMLLHLLHRFKQTGLRGDVKKEILRSAILKLRPIVINDLATDQSRDGTGAVLSS